MKFESKFFRNKVARRMLVFFVLSAFIPILFLAILSYWESNRMLVKQAHTRLDAAVDNYKMLTYDRLLLIDQILDDTSKRFSDGNWPTNAAVQLNMRFISLTLVLPTGNSKSIFGQENKMQALSAAGIQHLSSGKSILLTQRNGLTNKILLVRAQEPLLLERGVLVAEISPEALWGDPDAVAFDIGLCIFDENHIRLYCSQPFQTDPIVHLTQSTKGTFTWQDKQKDYIANYHEIFLKARFFIPHWIAVATQPELDALGSIKIFNTIFWGSVTLAVLLIMLFSMIQIRRVLVPLEKLIDGTRRLANNDFTTKVDVISPDEFGELATSFNAMSARLGEQFETLTALSKIDREILSGLNIDKITEQVLQRLQKMLLADFACIAVFNHDSTEKMYLCVLDEHGKQLPVQHHHLPNEMHQLLLTNLKGIWITSDSAHELIQFDQKSSDVAYLFILPLTWKDQMVGFITLGFHLSTTWREEETQRVQDYAVRVAVALVTKKREDLLLRQARIDALTGLPNRFLFVEQLQKEIAQMERVELKLAVLYIDLDRFKKVNDSLGHSKGDKLLCEASDRLQHCVRQSDMVARLGGDEFAIIISELESNNHIITVAKQVVATLGKAFVIDGEEHIVAASLGIAIYPQDGSNIAELMRNSDIAMYRAKENNGNQYVFFEESMNAEVIKHTTIERELRRAIVEQQFVLYYQPQVDPITMQVRGVEALVRWDHPERGIVAPGYFIGVAEDTGLIAEIGHIVLVEACAQYCAWLNQGIALEYVAVNVSVRQFRDPKFAQKVAVELQKNNMQAHCLELEITESVLMDDTKVVLETLHQLQHLGIQLSIDDFGTGYSSMSYLEQLPFDTLKIDMSFVRKIQDNGEGGTIAATIAAMAHALNKKVVAEGVETQAQLDFLRKHDCELIQGYFFSRPLPAEELASYVNKLVTQKQKIV